MKRNQRQRLVCLLMAGFLLGIYKGRIALWKDQDPEPVRVLPYTAELLPPPLHQALQIGIPIESMDDLEELLEKYLP